MTKPSDPKPPSAADVDRAQECVWEMFRDDDDIANDPTVNALAAEFAAVREEGRRAGIEQAARVAVDLPVCSSDRDLAVVMSVAHAIRAMLTPCARCGGVGVVDDDHGVNVPCPVCKPVTP
jgi:hypothetical protein